MQTITVEVSIEATIEKVWQCWTIPQHIMQWNNANEEWHTPSAINEPRAGGILNWRMEAKDGSFGFDFTGTYTDVIPQKYLAYALGDGRKVTVGFSYKEGHTTVTESFEPETVNSIELQQAGWQAILNNFKKYTESLT